VAPSKNKLLVLSDSDKLARALELNLQGRWHVVLRSIASPAPLAELNDLALIVVAASSPTSEPVVMLAQAELTQCIGVVPILIISERNFPSHPAQRINHLDFPFSWDMLHASLQRIQAGPDVAPLSPEGVGPASGAK
jgi:hypothetical protein